MMHLDLEELAAHVNGAPQAHVATCSECQAEVRGWNAVAGGVRLLGTTSLPPPRFVQDLPGYAPRRAGRRWAVLATAAALVLLVGAAYGLLGFSNSGTTPGTDPTDTGPQGVEAELTAGLTSTECEPLKVVAGTLESKDGSSFVIRTRDGESVTVSTSDTTRITSIATGSLSDITDGKRVLVHGAGRESGDQITAKRVDIVPETPRRPHEPGPNLGRIMAARGNASGTVADAGSDGFTVVQPDGARVRVTTTTTDTTVTKQVDSTVDDLQTGKRAVAVGSVGDDGTLAARTVQQNTLVESGIHIPRLRGDLFRGLGCDAAGIATTAMFATTG